jgi:hypothetical protein
MFDHQQAAAFKRHASLQKIKYLIVVGVPCSKEYKVPNAFAFSGSFKERGDLKLGHFAVADLDPKLFEVRSNKPAHPWRPLDKTADHCSARDGFDSHHAAAGTEVEKTAPFDPSRNDLEKDLPQLSVGVGHPRRNGILQAMAAELSVGYLVVECDLDLRLFRASRLVESFCPSLGFLVESSVPRLTLVRPCAPRTPWLSVRLAKFAVFRRAFRSASAAV